MNNALVYCKKGKNGSLFLYAEIELTNGEKVVMPICQPTKLYNRKLQYLRYSSIVII